MPASSPSIALVRICAYICPNAVPKGFLQPLRWLAVCQDKMLLQQDERGGRRQAGHATYTHGQQQSACLLFANIQKLIFICLLSLFASGQIVGRHDFLRSDFPTFPPHFPGPGPVPVSVSVLASPCGSYRIRHTHKSWPSRVLANFFSSLFFNFFIGPRI